ncbi:MAG: hypothetical protein AAF715_01325 [Myxococcota bacterium]
MSSAHRSRGGCPHCGQRAPLVLRGLQAYCTVCGRARPTLDALSSTPLNFAGTPAKVGGIAAKVFGIATLVSGLFVALLLTLVLQALFPALYLGFAVGIPIALVTLFVGGGALFGGWRLRRRGRRQVATAQRETIRGLGRHHRGVVRAREAAAALGVSEAEADALLTELARQPDENVGVEIDDDGQILFLFGSADAIRWRIAAEQSLDDEARRELEAEIEARAVEETDQYPAARSQATRSR